MKIAFCGKAGSGKTELANLLGYTKLALADPIKNIEKDLDNKSISNLQIYKKHIEPYYILDPLQLAIAFKIFDNARLLPREAPKPRKRLQYIGTDGFRMQIDSDIWVKITERIAETLGENVVIDDVRFPNEYKILKLSGWTLIKILVNDTLRISRLKDLYGEVDPEIFSHPSETAVDLIDAELTIDNNGTLEETKEKLWKLLQLT